MIPINLFLKKADIIGTFRAGSHYFLAMQGYFFAKIKLSLYSEVLRNKYLFLGKNTLAENSCIDLITSTVFVHWLFTV